MAAKPRAGHDILGPARPVRQSPPVDGGALACGRMPRDAPPRQPTVHALLGRVAGALRGAVRAVGAKLLGRVPFRPVRDPTGPHVQLTARAAARHGYAKGWRGELVAHVANRLPHRDAPDLHDEPAADAARRFPAARLCFETGCKLPLDCRALLGAGRRNARLPRRVPVVGPPSPPPASRGLLPHVRLRPSCQPGTLPRVRRGGDDPRTT